MNKTALLYVLIFYATIKDSVAVHTVFCSYGVTL